MTGIDPRDPVPAIKGATAHVAEADSDQALVDELHQLVDDGPVAPPQVHCGNCSQT